METVIQEIANQLGMAVDQTGQFITEQLPNYAALKVTQEIIMPAILWIVTIILMAVAFTFLHITVKHRRSDRSDESEYRYANYYTMDYSDYDTFWIFCIVGVIAVILLIPTLIYTGINLPNIIGWMNYPEAMLIDMAIKAVG